MSAPKLYSDSIENFLQRNLLVVVSSLLVFSITASVAVAVLLFQKQKLKRELRDAKNQLKQSNHEGKEEGNSEAVLVKQELHASPASDKAEIRNGDHLPRSTESSTPGKKISPAAPPPPPPINLAKASVNASVKTGTARNNDIAVKGLDLAEISKVELRSTKYPANHSDGSRDDPTSDTIEKAETINNGQRPSSEEIDERIAEDKNKKKKQRDENYIPNLLNSAMSARRNATASCSSDEESEIPDSEWEDEEQQNKAITRSSSIDSGVSETDSAVSFCHNKQVVPPKPKHIPTKKSDKKETNGSTQ